MCRAGQGRVGWRCWGAQWAGGGAVQLGGSPHSRRQSSRASAQQAAAMPMPHTIPTWVALAILSRKGSAAMPLLFTTITSAASEAAAVAVEAMATPTSAAASAGASLMPSPTMMTPPLPPVSLLPLLLPLIGCGTVLPAAAAAAPLRWLLSCCTRKSFCSGLQHPNRQASAGRHGARGGGGRKQRPTALAQPAPAPAAPPSPPSPPGGKWSAIRSPPLCRLAQCTYHNRPARFPSLPASERGLGLVWVFSSAPFPPRL